MECYVYVNERANTPRARPKPAGKGGYYLYMVVCDSSHVIEKEQLAGPQTETAMLIFG